MNKLCYYIFRQLFRILYTILFRYTVSGHENVPSEGGVIIAANHLSFLDPQLVGAALKRRATFMARSGLFKIPLIRTFVSAFSLPVDRKNTRPSTIKEAVRRLKKGELLVMFPEGERSQEGIASEGKRGVAAIASLSGARIVPVLIEGTDKALPRGARFIRPAKVRVTFGKSLMIHNDESKRDFQKRIACDIMSEIRKLSTTNRFQSNS